MAETETLKLQRQGQACATGGWAVWEPRAPRKRHSIDASQSFAASCVELGFLSPRAASLTALVVAGAAASATVRVNAFLHFFPSLPASACLSPPLYLRAIQPPRDCSPLASSPPRRCGVASLRFSTLPASAASLPSSLAAADPSSRCLCGSLVGLIRFPRFETMIAPAPTGSGAGGGGGLGRQGGSEASRPLIPPTASSFASSFSSSSFAGAGAAAQECHVPAPAAGNPSVGSQALGGAGLSQSPAAGTSSLCNPASLSASGASPQDKEHIYQLLLDICVMEKREAALGDLSKRREQFPDLAPLLWHSFGTIAAILQEIISIYPCLSPPTLTAAASNRVCNSLALLQCVASHPDTRQAFLNAHIPLFLYPFLNTVSKTRPLEYLRLTSLGVIGALVKIDDAEVINFLLQTEIIPLCLRIMETGSELSKTVATFIVQKILLDDVGLSYICATAERFYAVSTVLCNMVSSLAECPPARLLKHVIRCYLRLTDNNRAREALKQCLPDALKDATFHAALQDEPLTKKWLFQLLHAVAPSEIHNAAAVQP
ncbi:hypothetical protein BESB_002600 [Besnoitia besnoiti]|uniref:Cell differentiation protein RCD1 n=1 Tax=Besnoitia besnoiti TaxID=94643 RepID=A0A2A9MJ25_BESBE|nr:hypothetical protein BESB_002600 [Besnoitia besnoiti]PFH37919.1 hypothetical protein BESB_002600 [Besnoitia besnoiti]